MSKFHYNTLVALLLAAGLSATTVDARDGGFEPTIGYGFQAPDEDRGLDESSDLLYFGLGYYLTEDLMLEGYAAEHDTNTDTGIEVGNSQYGAKLLYHFSQRRPGVQPYLALGINEIEYAPTGATSLNETGVMLGLGIKTYFSERLSLRAEVNSTRYEETKKQDNQLFIGLSYLFGGESHAAVEEDEPAEAAPAVAAAAVVAAAPADSDGDGVFDDADQCPTTPAGRSVDATGCEKVLKEAISVRMNVLFDTNKATLKPESFVDIERLAKAMQEYATTKVIIEGHTDSSGDNALNKSLSEARAKAVADALVGQYQIDASRVSSVGYGEDKPVADNSTEAGRAQNRRVQAEISETVQVTPK